MRKKKIGEKENANSGKKSACECEKQNGETKERQLRLVHQINEHPSLFLPTVTVWKLTTAEVTVAEEEEKESSAEQRSVACPRSVGHVALCAKPTGRGDRGEDGGLERDKNGSRNALDE